MQDISTFISSLHIGAATPATPETAQTETIATTPKAANIESPGTWERYYIENVQGNENGGGTTPENIDLNAPISQRYEQIKLFRILGYKKEFRRARTKMFFELEDICRAHFFPLFFVLDFEEYQNERRWMINGKAIKNIKGAFYLFAKAKRERMRAAGSWRGHDMKKYVYCGAWEIITK